jgi:hypothetical protein
MPHIDTSRRGVTHSRFQSSADANSFSYTRLHAVQRFFNRSQLSADTKGKQGRRLTPYSLFFCLGWFQKNEKTPDPPRQLYDDELAKEEEEEDHLDVPIPTTRYDCSHIVRRITNALS